MDKRFERFLIILMGAAFVFLIMTHYSSASSDETLELKNQYPGIMRFHVIANSDSEDDQTLKLKIRDYVLERVQNELAREMANANETMGDNFSESVVLREYVYGNLEQIETWTYEGLKLYDSKYKCKVSVGIRHIPAKYYDDIFFPEGNYEALTITIGEGKGQNWWCVVFPPLCLVENEDSSYKSSLDMSEDDKIQLKSKVLEIMEEARENNASASISSILKGIYAQKAIDTFFVKI